MLIELFKHAWAGAAAAKSVPVLTENFLQHTRGQILSFGHRHLKTPVLRSCKISTPSLLLFLVSVPFQPCNAFPTLKTDDLKTDTTQNSAPAVPICPRNKFCLSGIKCRAPLMLPCPQITHTKELICCFSLRKKKKKKRFNFTWTPLNCAWKRSCGRAQPAPVRSMSYETAPVRGV